MPKLPMIKILHVYLHPKMSGHSYLMVMPADFKFFYF